jgi:hypothetical protein
MLMKYSRTWGGAVSLLSIIVGVITRSLLAVLVCCLLAACNRAPQDEGAVRQALQEHLSKNAGLDMNAVDMEITNLRFEGNTARAQVAFKPKAAPSEGMQMSYTLERRGEKWVVQGRGAGHGGAMGGGMGSGGAPGAMQPPAAGELPAGHPPVSGSDKGTGELPAGHPPVTDKKGSSQPAK